MFDDIDNTIKKLAKILFILNIIGGVIWIIMSIRSDSSLLTPIVMCIVGVTSSIVIYGFGEVITILDDMNSKMKEDKEHKYNF